MRLGIACLFLIACSDDDKVRKLPDAPPAPDTPDVDAATNGPVSLTILEGTMPRVGIRVIFQNADSSLVSDTTTGTDGKATATMEPGGYVTAIDPFPGRQSPGGVAQRTDIRTFAGVKPGDQLRLFVSDLNATAVTVNVVLPIEANAFEYRVSTNCSMGNSIPSNGSGAQPMGQISMQGCGPTANLLAEVIDQGNKPSHSIYKASVALTDGGTIDLTADSYTATPDATFMYSNVPAGIGFVFVDSRRFTSVGPIREFAETLDVSSGSGTLSTRIPTNITGAAAVTVSRFAASGLTTHELVEWGAPNNAYTLDPTGKLLPEFGALATLDPANHRVQWTQSGGLSPDFVEVDANLSRDVGGTTESWHWRIAAPGGAQAVLPVLPNSSTLNPVAGDTANFQVILGKVPGGYDAVRANMLSRNIFDHVGVATATPGNAAFAILTEPGL